MGLNVNGVTLSSNGSALSVDKAALNWMKINANGIITRPQTPYFRGILNGQGSFYLGNPIIVGGVQSNVGGYWNAATGIWTCPVAGNYMACMSGIASGSLHGGGTSGYIYIYRNSAVYVFNHWSNASYWDPVALSAVVKCAAGDTINFGVIGSAAPCGLYGANGHGSFSIGLIL